MSDLNLYIKLSTLPHALQAEIKDYMEFLISRRLQKKSGYYKHPKAGCMRGTFKMSSDFDEYGIKRIWK